MKKNMFTLLFGLLLAVGWTSNAFAQSYTLKASEMQTNGVYWTYDWVDANGDTQTSTYVNPATNVADSVTDPYQIYGLLRAVYMDKRLPGPYYSAYTYNYQREDPVFYGGMTGGWDIPYTAGGTVTYTYDAITITTTSWNAYITAISIVDATTDEEIESWTQNTNVTNQTLPTGWSASTDLKYYSSDGGCYMGTSNTTGGTITISSSHLNTIAANHSSIRVYVTSFATSNNTYTLYIGNASATLTTQSQRWYYDFNGTTGGSGDDNLYKPDHEGYTALVVALYNDSTKIRDESNDPYDGAWEFSNKTDLINYIKNNISHVKLLTDGLRIGSGYNVGTVFNASGTYNKFFFLGKGQARKKAPRMLERIASSTWNIQGVYCEEGPFKYMFEEFSPTTGDEGSDITDFYIEMMDGKVYPVVHDCASVIQNKHQFSMSGRKGTEYKALSGLNFFIPDYRLLYWYDRYSPSGSSNTYTVDGRDMNPYEQVNQTTGARGNAFGSNTTTNYYSHWSVYYAQYNQQHPPLVGIYMIHLDAEAEPAAAPRTYTVNLDWTSSLNDMSGSTVPQTYTVYVVNTDENGVETLDTLVVTGQTHYDYTVPQDEHSYTITYIVQGTPADSEHPEFVAWSNQDAVVIPGWNDFLSLALEHYESDFDVPKVRNWYRNFLAVDNENADNALTTTRIAGGENNYTLLRYDYNNPNVKEEVATLSFEVKNGGKTVDYTAALTKQAVEESKYLWSALGFTMTSETMTAGTTKGTLSVKGNGDIVIQPSGYDVNFYSITVTSGNQTVTSWNANQTLASRGWEVTNGSKFIKDTGTNYYYLEGGGYIRIPYTVLGNYTNVRVVINASRDASKTAWISVNEDKQTMTTAAATNYTWNSVNTTSNAKLNAPNRATVNTDVTFTVGTNSGTNTQANSADQMSNGTVTINSTLAAFGRTDNYRIAANSTTTISTATGKITKIVFNGNSNQYPVNRLSTTTGNYSVSNNVGTWTGEATSVNFSASGQARCTSIVVTVTTDDGSGGTTTDEITVCDGQYWADMLPVFGYYHDTDQHNQMVYPASMLSAMTGKTIKSMTFYPTSGYVDANENGQYDSGETIYSGLNFYGGSVTFKLANLSSGTGAYADQNATLITGTMTPVKTLTPTANSSATTWLIEFDQDFVYDGGDLLIDVTSVAGTYSHTAFTVDAVDANYGVLTMTYGGTDYALGLNYLPKVTFTYEDSSAPPTPVSEGMVRLGNLPLVDQFYADIPATNNHPNRYAYVLRYVSPDTTINSTVAEVPVQHTGAVIEGYYTIPEMDNDLDPTNFLPVDMLSAEVDMNLSPSSAPYFYTVNSKLNGVPATAWNNYVNVLQRRSDGSYQEMLTKGGGVDNPYYGNIYPAGEFDQVDYRHIQAAAKTDSLSYVPIVWTMGIDRRYFADDSIHNSYGAPVWEVRVGDIEVGGAHVERQAANALGDWNPAVNWYDENGNACSLFIVDNLQATGILPECNVEYEPYMFRVWVVGDGLRGYQWVDAGVDPNLPGRHVVNDPDAPRTSPQLIYTKMCSGANDLTLAITKNSANDYANSVMFGALNTCKPTFLIRFYYKVKGSSTVLMRDGEVDHVGYVVMAPADPGDPSTYVYEIIPTAEVVSKIYYNTQGMMSEEPFDGVNIVVTRYSDGTTTTTKVIR